jgi:hypothetical protein
MLEDRDLPRDVMAIDVLPGLLDGRGIVGRLDR